MRVPSLTEWQFNVRNTLNDQVIDNVSVEMVPDEDAEGFKYVRCPR